VVDAEIFFYDFSGPKKILGTAILGGPIDNTTTLDKE
jgi:hypothetical protein